MTKKKRIPKEGSQGVADESFKDADEWDNKIGIATTMPSFLD